MTVIRVAVGVFLGLVAFWGFQALVNDRGDFGAVFLRASAFLADLPDRWGAPEVRPAPVVPARPVAYDLKWVPLVPSRLAPVAPVAPRFEARRVAPAPLAEITVRAVPDGSGEVTRRSVAALRMKEAECRVWRDRRGQVDPDTIAENLEEQHCYPE